jgi:two-component system, cell cycle response regulator
MGNSFERPDAPLSDVPAGAAGGGLAAIVGRLHGLKPFPDTAQRLLSAVCDPNHRGTQVVSIIETDPELTAKVLRLVNSGAFGLRHICESVERSIVLLGTRQVAELAAARLALDQFEGSGKLGKTIRSHSIAVAGLSRRLARRRPLLAGVDTFTPGILHDVGKLLQLQADQGQYAQLLSSAPHEASTFQLLERAHLGYDHAMLADYVMDGWHIPEFLRTVVALHHNQDATWNHSGQVVEAVAVLRLADHLDYALQKDPSGDCASEVAALDAAELVELAEADLRALWPELLDLKKRM